MAPVSLGEPAEAPARERAALRELVLPLLGDARTPGAAAVAINDRLWTAAGIAFSHQIPADPDFAPAESLAARSVSCVSGSILLVAACRAVAIPARVVGIPAWPAGPDPERPQRGYHQWVEVWDGSWRHLSSFDRGELDRGWYAPRVAATDVTQARHRVYAAASVVSPLHFPLPWSRRDRSVPGRDVTAFYTRRREVRVELAPGTRAELAHAGELVAVATAARPAVALAAGERYAWRLLDPAGRELDAGEVVLAPDAATLALR